MKIFFLSMIFLLGCDLKVQHEDVSAEPASKAAIGERFEVVGELDAYGVRSSSRESVDYITLVPPPGFDGAEVGFRITVRPGSTITVRKVMRTNRLSHRMTFLVDLEGTPMPVAAPVRIDMSRGNEAKGYLQLNPALYRKVFTKN